jgi:glycosyltransferase involved in cell wall biosynthesis
MKVAIVHDALNQYGGAEKVLEELHAIFPDAPVFCPVYLPKVMPADFADWDIRPSWMNRLPGANRYHRIIFPLYPLAMHGLDLSGYDVVITSSFNFAHNIVVDPDACHICYCHSPSRFLWDFHGYARRERFSAFKRALIMPFLPTLRTQDAVSAQRVDAWIATSRVVQQRIRKVYGRRSTIIAPPVDLLQFSPAARRQDDYFLLLMRFVAWKRADLVIEACNKLKLKLVVAGDGRERARLERLAGPTITFAGRVAGRRKADLFANCAAFILPAVEDFGIASIEAMASGRPVIAVRAGGALDTVVAGITGEFFADQTTASLEAVLRDFDPDAYDPAVIRGHAESYASERFRARMRGFVEAVHARNKRLEPREPSRVVRPPLGPFAVPHDGLAGATGKQSVHVDGA